MSAINIAKLSRAFLAGVVLPVLAGLLLSVAQAWAETVKGRMVWHNIKVEKIEVGDVPDHIVGVAEQKGLVLFENGEVATYSRVGTFEETEGSGTHQGYGLNTFEDMSTQIIKWKGTHTESQEGKPQLFKGTYTYLRGSGRFAGIQGGGSYSGKGFKTLGFAGATAYCDFTGTYTLPEK